MTYVVLARKWRPQKFSDMIGQEAIARTLENAIRLSRVPHAILFTGTRGVGKTTSARILAKALNCEKGPTPEPCNECSNCVEISAGTNVDVLEIDGASNTSVEDVRDLRETVRYAPSKSRHKIYIIDEVHMLSTSAFNALLKTLEEPPPGVIFIFATTEPQKIPDTIHSRCQRFDFKQVSDAEIAKHLHTITTAEKIALSEVSIRLIARQAFGSMRDALSLLEQVIAFSADSEGTISESQVVNVLGLTDRSLILKTLEDFVARNDAAALETLAQVFAKGYDPKTYLEEVWEKTRDLLILKAVGRENLLSATSDEIARMKEWISSIEVSEFERWFDILKYACQEISRVQFPRYLIEVAFLKITRREEGISLSTLVDRLEALETSLSKQPSAARPVAQAPMQPARAPSAEKKTSAPDFLALVDALKGHRPQIAAILLQALSHRFEDGIIHLGFAENSFYFERARERDFQSHVCTMARELFGMDFTIRIETGQKEAPSPKLMAEEERAKEKEALEDPIVKKAMSVLGAKVEDVRSVK